MFTSRQLLCALSFAISTAVLTASETNKSSNNLLEKARVFYNKHEPTVANALFQFPLNPLNLEKQRIEKTRALVVPDDEEGRKAQQLYIFSENSTQQCRKGYGNLFLIVAAAFHKLRISPTHLPVVMLIGSSAACWGLAASGLPHYDMPTLYDMYEEHRKEKEAQKEKEENGAASGPSLGEWYPNPKRGLHGLRG